MVVVMVMMRGRRRRRRVVMLMRRRKKCQTRVVVVMVMMMQGHVVIARVGYAPTSPGAGRGAQLFTTTTTTTTTTLGHAWLSSPVHGRWGLATEGVVRRKGGRGCRGLAVAERRNGEGGR